LTETLQAYINQFEFYTKSPALKRPLTEVMSGASHPDPKVEMAFFVAQHLEAEIPACPG
jgi:hypothetical protein